MGKLKTLAGMSQESRIRVLESVINGESKLMLLLPTSGHYLVWDIGFEALATDGTYVRADEDEWISECGYDELWAEIVNGEKLASAVIAGESFDGPWELLVEGEETPSLLVSLEIEGFQKTDGVFVYENDHYIRYIYSSKIEFPDLERRLAISEDFEGLAKESTRTRQSDLDYLIHLYFKDNSGGGYPGFARFLQEQGGKKIPGDKWEWTDADGGTQRASVKSIKNRLSQLRPGS